MCGVISIVYPKQNPALGREAGALVRYLEYRGYEPTGVAVIAEDGAITLRNMSDAQRRVASARRSNGARPRIHQPPHAATLPRCGAFPPAASRP